MYPLLQADEFDHRGSAEFALGELSIVELSLRLRKAPWLSLEVSTLHMVYPPMNSSTAEMSQCMSPFVPQFLSLVTQFGLVAGA